MPVKQCRTCGFLVTDPSRPRPSCGNMNGQPVPSAKSPVYNNDGASVFSVGAVLSRSFSAFFKHPLVFVGLSFLALLPGLALTALMRNAGILERLTQFISFVLGLAIQGAIAYGVYEVLRGSAARFGECLSRGMARVIPLAFASLSFSIFFVLIMSFVGMALIAVIGGIGIIIIPALILTTSVLFCKWSVFIPACVVERLGPIKSLRRSSILTKGCRSKIAGLYLLCFVIIFTVVFVLGFITEMAGIAGAWISSLIQQLANAFPLAFTQVMTAVMYYELRNVKEGVTVESLANVFD